MQIFHFSVLHPAIMRQFPALPNGARQQHEPNTTMKTIAWNNANGQEIKINIKLIGNMVNFDASVAGNDIGHIIGGLKPVTGHPVAVASLGKLALNAERAEQVKKAIAEVEATREASGRSTDELKMDEFDRQGHDLARKMSAQA